MEKHSDTWVVVYDTNNSIIGRHPEILYVTQYDKPNFLVSSTHNRYQHT